MKKKIKSNHNDNAMYIKNNLNCKKSVGLFFFYRHFFSILLTIAASCACRRYCLSEANCDVHPYCQHEYNQRDIIILEPTKIKMRKKKEKKKEVDGTHHKNRNNK